MFEILQEFLGDGVKGQSVAAFYLWYKPWELYTSIKLSMKSYNEHSHSELITAELVKYQSVEVPEGSYPEPVNLVHTLRTYFLNIRFNIILPSTPIISKVVSSLKILCLKFCMNFSFPHACYRSRPFHPSLFNLILFNFGE
jgi:hypothetical protein